MASSTFTQKQLRVTFTLANPSQTFPGTGNNVLQASGLRMHATFQSAALYKNALNLQVFGLRAQDMNALTVLYGFGYPQTAVQNNTLLLESNDGSGWNAVFTGTIMNAYPDYQGVPDVSLQVQCVACYFSGNQAGAQLSLPNGASAVSVLQSIAKAMGLQLIAAPSINAQLPKGTYIPGTYYDQLDKVCQKANLTYYIENTNLVVVPKSNPVRGDVTTVYVLSPGAGLISYPQIEVAGISFQCLYTPLIRPFGRLQITGSAVPAANGYWSPYSGDHVLSTLMPEGEWISTFHATQAGAS